MRDYSKVSGAFWTGRTGKALRGDMDAQVVAMYLMTTSHANMIGVFSLPVGYIQIDTGLPLEGAFKGLKRLCEDGFCTYDDDSETVFVHEMAHCQIGDSLKPTDNRVKDIRKQCDNISEPRIKSAFLDKYRQAFCLEDDAVLQSPLQAPSKPVAVTVAVTVSEKDKTIVRSNPTRFEEFWQAWPKSQRKVGKVACLKKWKDKKLDGIADQIIQHVIEISKTKPWTTGFDPAPMTYLNQGRWADEIFADEVIGPRNSKPWFISASGIEAKALELGIVIMRDEAYPDFKVRVYRAAGVTKADVTKATQDFSDKR